MPDLRLYIQLLSMQPPHVDVDGSVDWAVVAKAMLIASTPAFASSQCTWEHLYLVLCRLCAAWHTGRPLGQVLARGRRLMTRI
eukprot:SAG31_NODE_1722_length_7452_cov_2.771658_6_plen_83_part_00